MDWLIVILGLVGLTYAAFKIKTEKSDFLDSAYDVVFEDLTIPVPEWWTQVDHPSGGIRFERTDTRYDWYGQFEFIKEDPKKELPEILKEFIEKEEIDYDKDDVVIETDSRHIFKDPLTQERFQEIIRVEGKASYKIINRAYIDFIFMRDTQKPNGYFIMRSWSSVLNGMLEGPFFEESISRLQIKSNT